MDTPERQREIEMELLIEVDFAAIDVLTVVNILTPSLPAQLEEALKRLAERRQAVSDYRSKLSMQFVPFTTQI